ncbi:hypothetical protein J4214_00965 [Candidatus Woesearchaeota archaeon]|nr:hypothetical protein [Candidatus Woesearchaeota archaeon]
MNNWRDEVGKDISDHLEAQINESTKYKEAYEQAPDKGNAQLWVAIATISKQVFDLNLRIKYLEILLKDFDRKIKDSNNELQNEMKEIEKSIKNFTDIGKDIEDYARDSSINLEPKIEEEQIAEIKYDKKKEEPEIKTKPKIKGKKVIKKKNKSKKFIHKRFIGKKNKRRSLAKVLRKF